MNIWRFSPSRLTRVRPSTQVDLMYPKSLLEPQQLVDALKKQLDSREVSKNFETALSRSE